MIPMVRFLDTHFWTAQASTNAYFQGSATLGQNGVLRLV
jgi:hypothetical protein